MGAGESRGERTTERGHHYKRTQTHTYTHAHKHTLYKVSMAVHQDMPHAVWVGGCLSVWCYPPPHLGPPSLHTTSSRCAVCAVCAGRMSFLFFKPHLHRGGMGKRLSHSQTEHTAHNAQHTYSQKEHTAHNAHTARQSTWTHYIQTAEQNTRVQRTMAFSKV